MKRIVLLSFLTLSTFLINAQEFSYGVVTGTSIYNNKIEGPLSTGAGFGVHFGGYAEYQINDKFGVKSNLIYSLDRIDTYRSDNFSGTFDARTSSFQLHTLVKYDVNSEYNKGFYLLAGPRASFILNVKDEDGDKLENFYKSSNFGIQFGFGVNFATHYGLEIVGDYGLSNFLDSDSNDGHNEGVYINFTINLESIFKN